MMKSYDGNSALGVKCRERARERYWSVFDEETHACQRCGCDGTLQIHHKDGDWLNNELLNLVAVCHACHKQIHRRAQIKHELADWKAQVERVAE